MDNDSGRVPPASGSQGFAPQPPAASSPVGADPSRDAEAMRRGLPATRFEGRSKTVRFDGDRFVTLGFGTSDLRDRCWMVRAGTGANHIDIGLSEEAMDQLVSMYVAFILEDDEANRDSGIARTSAAPTDPEAHP